MHQSFDPVPAARRLAAAWRADARLDELPAAERPRDLAEGYAVQVALADELGGIAGYKLGLSSAAAMARSGLGGPARGFMTGDRIKRSGATLAPVAGPLLVEVEIAFVLARDVPAGTRVADPAGLVGDAHLAIEVVRSRFNDRIAVGLPSFLADSVGFHALLLSDPLPGGVGSDLLGAPAELLHDGTRVAGPLDGPERTDPLHAFKLFLDQAAAANLPVAKGMIVTTGTLVAAYESDARGRYEARLGPASVSFTI